MADSTTGQTTVSRSIVRRSASSSAVGPIRQRKLERTRNRLAADLLIREVHGQADIILVHRLSGTAMDLELDLLEAGRARAGDDQLMLRLVASRVEQAILLDSLVIRDHTT